MEALVAQVSETGRNDFAVAEVAELAGVSPRTVYRHFPTRDDLIEAIVDHVDQCARPEMPNGPEDLPRHLTELFAWFEDNAEMIEASHVAGLGREVRAAGRKRRGDQSRDWIDEWAAALPEAERLRAWGVFRAMIGSQSWRTMRRELGLSPEQATDAMQWVLGLMLDDLRKRSAELGGEEDE